MNTYLTLDPADLRKAVDFVARAVVPASMATSPVLGTVKLEGSGGGRVRFRATDLDMDVVMWIEATVYKPFAFCIPLHILQAVAKAALGPVSFSRDGEMHTIEDDKGLSSKLRLICPPEDFPDVFHETQGRPWGRESVASERSLHHALRRAIPCISTEETRYYLNGVFLTTKPDSNTLRAVATDGHRAAIQDTVEEWTCDDAILPAKAAKFLFANLVRNGNRAVRIEEASRHWLRFSCEDFKITTKLIDGIYPDYVRVIPKEIGKIDVSITRAGVKRLMAFTRNGRGACVVFDVVKGRMSMTTFDDEEVETSVPLQVAQRTEEKFGFDGKHLLDLLNFDPSLRLRGSSCGTPFVVDGEDPSGFWVLMPMRVH